MAEPGSSNSPGREARRVGVRGDVAALTVRLASSEDASTPRAPGASRRRAHADAADPRGGVRGELVAALPLTGGMPLDDPFRSTAELLRLLELRAAQLLRGGQAEPRGAER